MKRLPFLLVLLLLGCRPLSTVEAERPPAIKASPGWQVRTVRVASWNVRNLFDATDDSHNDERLSEMEVQRKLRELVLTIEVIDPDILALQEVENIEVLRLLNQGLARPYPVLGLIEGNDQGRGIDVAFLSRLPVNTVRSHKDRDLADLDGISRGYLFSRDCLQVDLETEPPVTLLINHFKSQRGDHKTSATKRRAQALEVVEIAGEVTGARPETALVVLGDLNDRPDSWALEPLFEEFKDVFAHMAVAQRATHRYHKEDSALDHILLNDKAWTLHQRPLVWKELPVRTSDHRPVSVQLTVGVPPALVTDREWTK